MCCWIERARIVLEILIEVERPNPQRASLATLAPLRMMVQVNVVYVQAIDVVVLLSSDFACRSNPGLYECIRGGFGLLRVRIAAGDIFGVST